jgi:hypothetical protein
VAKKTKNADRVKALEKKVQSMEETVEKHEEIITILAADHYKRRGLIPDIAEGNISQEEAMAALRPPVPGIDGTEREAGDLGIGPGGAIEQIAKQEGMTMATDTKRERARGKTTKKSIRKPPLPPKE